jgi:hypothetical protein
LFYGILYFMNLWRRSRSETTQPATEFNDENNAQPELLLGRFVEQNRDVLRKSSDLWAAVQKISERVLC